MKDLTKKVSLERSSYILKHASFTGLTAAAARPARAGGVRKGQRMQRLWELQACPRSWSWVSQRATC